MAAKIKSIQAKATSTNYPPAMNGGVEKMPTGIKGFDEVLEGGVPKGRAILIVGTTGTGKTVFVNEFVYHGITQYDQNAVYVTFEEHVDDVIKNVRNFGWDYDMLIRQKKLAFVDASPDSTSISESGEYNLSALIERIKHAINKVKAQRVVIDALSMLYTKFSNKDMIRNVIYRICDELKKLGVTSMITAEKNSTNEINYSRLGVEEYVSDGVVELQSISGEQKFLRKLFIKKLRGTDYRSGTTMFDITKNGLVIYPKLNINRNVSKTDFKMRSKFGIKSIDDAMGGGIPKGHMFLITGNTGTGKTLFGMHFLHHGIKDGQNAVFVAFDEPIEQVKKTALEFGMHFEKYEKEEKLIFICPSLIDMYSDRVLNEIVDAANKINAKRVVIDSVSSLMSASMDDESVRQFLIQISGFFKTKGISCIMNCISGANFGASKGQLLASLESNVMRLSPLVDGIMILLYVERGQRVKRILNVLKMRGSWHSNDIYKYEIKEDGIRLGERYEE